ncbi:MAG TPA: hypothetical protein VIH58_05120 [Chthoniobacterales bacterium]|jgi:hypothetical protein
MAGVLEENDNRLTDREPIAFTDLEGIIDRPNQKRNMKAIRVNFTVLPTLALVVGAGLIVLATFGTIVQMDEDLIVVELNAHMVAPPGPQR